jgi:hypothetical protein
MIISETILIKTFANKKLKHYSNLGYDISKEEIEVKIEDIPKSISDNIIVKCDYCQKVHERKIVDYFRIISKTDKYACSRKCGVIKFKETISLIDKKPHPQKGKRIDKDKLEKALEKRKKTNLEKWGVEHVLQNKEIKEKFNETNILRYGTDNFSKTYEFVYNQKKNSLEKWGVEHHSQSNEIKNKIKETNLEKWGVKSTLNIEKSNIIRNTKLRSEEFRKNDNISEHTNYIRYEGESKSIFNCDCNENHEFSISYDNFKGRLDNNIPLCTVCYPIGDHRSIKEKEIYDFISSIYDKEIIQSYRDKLEIDIYLPDLKLGFEFNGLYWHSDKYKDKWYHLSKIDHFKEKEIRIFNIWENDWNHRKNIIKSQIENLLNLNKKIFARKCEIKEIKDIKIVKQFLDDNHIQGFVKSNIKIGLFNNEELVSIMIFDTNEGRKKMNDNEYNISRFCNKLGTTVVGGASKILKYFIDVYNPSRIISYADKDWSSGSLYTKLGFIRMYDTSPDYRYIVKNELVHKSKYRKSYTGISESELNIPKIWNCGKIKFELDLNKI